MKTKQVREDKQVVQGDPAHDTPAARDTCTAVSSQAGTVGQKDAGDDSHLCYSVSHFRLFVLGVEARGRLCQ